MANNMKIAYYNGFHAGHFPHFYPYYKKLGGLVYVNNEKSAKELLVEYPELNITTDLTVLDKYRPDIILYADYHIRPKMRTYGAKHIMVFHAMENKGYMAVKRDWNWCEKFGLCLLYGNKILQEFKHNGYNIRYKIIGYPRFDDIKEINVKIFNNDRKTILVAPTWSNESLLTKFTDEILKLSETYNVILKPHPVTMEFRDATNSVTLRELIKKQSDTFKVFMNLDILPLMKYCDLMVTDVSGCSNEFMYFNKPLVIADTGVPPIATGVKPDIWKVFKVTDKPEELSKIVASQLKNDEMKEVRNNHFKQVVYDEKDTTATERGIKAMREVIKNGS